MFVLGVAKIDDSCVICACLTSGHVGYSDSSKEEHATKHFYLKQ